MTTVSTGENKNTITVSGDTARYYGDLAKQYRDECKTYSEEAATNAQTVLDKVDEINQATDTAIENISNLQATATNAINEQMVFATNNIALEAEEAKGWANKMDGTVDDEEYSAKYYANQAKEEHEQALTDISTSVASAKTAALNEITAKKNESKTELQNKYNECVSIIDDQADSVVKNCDRLYTGTNLETKFANEILLHNNVYEWLENRKNTGNFEGIHVGDYFSTSIKAGTIAGYSIAAQTFTCRIVGINTYKNCADAAIGNMFYIMTDQVINTPIKWNPTDNNNGTSVRKNPWLASAMYAILNGVNNYDATNGYNKVAHGADGGAGIISLLPTELQAVLKQKRNILDERYSASGLLTGGTGWAWADMGKLWLPNEIEVYGCGIRSNVCQTAGFWFPEAGLSIQFPWFANNCEHRIKKNSSGGRCNWWLSSVASHNSTSVCIVSSAGIAGNIAAAYATVYVPLCFCI